MDLEKQREVLTILQKLKQEKEKLSSQNSSLKQENEKLIYQNKLLINKIKSSQEEKYKVGDSTDLDSNLSDDGISEVTDLDKNGEGILKNKKKKRVDMFDILLIIIILLLLCVQIFILVK